MYNHFRWKPLVNHNYDFSFRVSLHSETFPHKSRTIHTWLNSIWGNKTNTCWMLSEWTTSKQTSADTRKVIANLSHCKIRAPCSEKKILARSINVQEFNQCDIVWGYLQYKHPLWSNCIIQNHLQKKLLITWYHLCRSMKIWSECVNISAKISASIEKLKEKTKIFLLELILIKS